MSGADASMNSSPEAYIVEDWSLNNFFSHTLPTADSYKAVVSYCQKYMSQLMRLWYLTLRLPVKAQASLRTRAVSPEPSLFAHIKYGSR